MGVVEDSEEMSVVDDEAANAVVDEPAPSEEVLGVRLLCTMGSSAFLGARDKGGGVGGYE
jgi:hypothetical protein